MVLACWDPSGVGDQWRKELEERGIFLYIYFSFIFEK
jgi:hypothetical protein